MKESELGKGYDLWNPFDLLDVIQMGNLKAVYNHLDLKSSELNDVIFSF